MSGYIVPLLFLALLFVGFGLLHGNGEKSRGCVGCTGCANPGECENQRNDPDVAPDS